MHPALILIIGVMGPLILGCIIGIIYMLDLNKKEHSEYNGQVAPNV